MQIEYGPAPLVKLQHRLKFGQETLRESLHLFEVSLRIHKNSLHVTRNQVAQYAERQRQVLVYQRV